MTKEELMKPRYKVIANYPQSIFPIDTIITTDKHGNWVKFFKELEMESCAYVRHLPSSLTPEKYPHLFKKLAWWEEREIEDMPKYLRWGKIIFESPSYNETGFYAEGVGWIHFSEYEISPSTERAFKEQENKK